MTSSPEPKKGGLKEAILNRRMLICIFNGFTAGMPLYYIYHLIPAWLRTENVDLKTIGLFSLVGIPYTWKFLWSPAMDRFVPPFLGRRRGWMIITQIFIMLSMFGFAFFDPQKSIWTIAYLAAALAFFSASQDIVLDAYRRELLPDEELGLGNSMYMNGYRSAVFIPGGLGLILADHFSWFAVHFLIGLFMLIGIAKTLMIKELDADVKAPKSIRQAVVEPLTEFFGREGYRSGLLLLAFLFLYKIGDNMATALSTPFYLDMGFSKTTIGSLVKLTSFWSMMLGTFAGGVVIFKVGINRSLWLFGVVQLVSILGFAVLSEVGPLIWVLAIVIAFEYLGVGLGAAALTAFMARATNKNFTATQFALFTSLIALPRTFANSITGFLIEGIGPEDGWLFDSFGQMSGLGYTKFFLFCTVMAIPGMILLKWVAPWSVKDLPQKAS
ncbi:MAG: AmpG family muropeptide MFS transporter [Bdellovibrionaceae bacterium]|nr:AmpG family muropeptide MFS transporter [Pseudobdellovibrionaceae bacterium]